MTGEGKVVNPPISRTTLDSSGSAIGAVRLNPALSYPAIPNLLKKVIDEGSKEAWADIRSRIDYTFTCLGHALGALEDVIGKYHNAVVNGDTLLPFVIYVPAGYGSTGNGNIPNVEETDDTALIFTASFNDGQEHWQKLDMTAMP